MILKLIISKGHYSAKQRSRSNSSYMLSDSQFHENILDDIKVIKQKRFSLEIFQRGIISQKL